MKLFALTALLTLAAAVLPAQTKTKILLDTDTGTDIDDAWALAFVALNPELRYSCGDHY